jgi:hypothetical protein
MRIAAIDGVGRAAPEGLRQSPPRGEIEPDLMPRGQKSGQNSANPPRVKVKHGRMVAPVL